jgi:hypothetical protein
VGLAVHHHDSVVKVQKPQRHWQAKSEQKTRRAALVRATSTWRRFRWPLRPTGAVRGGKCQTVLLRLPQQAA